MSTITLTKDQEQANNAFLDFLVSDEPFLRIRGAAGTGKSFLIKHLLETYEAKYKAYCLMLQEDPQNFDIRLTATTNKAVSVMDEFLEDYLKKHPDLDVCTVFSLLGLRVVNDRNSGRTNLEFTKNGASFTQGTVPLIFIDEASFVTQELHEIIEAVAVKTNKAKVIYIGDQYQLISPGSNFSVLTDLNLLTADLEEVRRNSGHILAMATQFRETVRTGRFQPIHYNGVDVLRVDGPTFKQMVDDEFCNRNWEPRDGKILAWTNERVQAYNDYIRQKAGRGKLLEVGERVITNEFIHGQNFARSVDAEVQITQIDSVPITMHGVPGRMIEVDHSHVAFMANDFKATKQLLKQLARDAKAAAKGETSAIWQKYFEVKESWLDLRPLYGSSVHKSQGSTYTTVYIDLEDIGSGWDADVVARLLYVAISRGAEKVVCYGQLPGRYA